MCLFSRLSTCAPVDENACGSSEDPMSWTRSKSFKNIQRPLRTHSKAFELLRPHQLAATFHGTAGINHAGAIIRAGANIRARALGVLGGVLLSKTTKSLYIRFFLFFISYMTFQKA